MQPDPQSVSTPTPAAHADAGGLQPVHAHAAAWAAPGVVLLVAAVFIAGYEGYAGRAAPDPGGVPTRCFGDTGPHVRLGEEHTRAECAAILADRLAQTDAAVTRCVHVPVSPQRRVALLSFAYNVGHGAFCSSTLVARLNHEDPRACEELDRWVYDNGRRLPGLVKRRAEERALCEDRAAQ